MTEIKRNPQNGRAAYINRLNTCFNGWGGNERYEWLFEREVGGLKADIFIFGECPEKSVAGSAISYRKLINRNGETADIGIMTGSWTLPESRGQGYFTKIIEVSRKICCEKGIPYLAAFVMETNASFRRLRDAGSVLIPSYTLFSPVEPYNDVSGGAISIVEDSESFAGSCYATFVENSLQATTFHYSLTDFSRQYIYRPSNTDLIEIDNEKFILEESHNASIVLLLNTGSNSLVDKLKTLANWSLQHKKKPLLLYTTQKTVALSLESEGFKCLNGYFTVVGSCANESVPKEFFNNVNINMGDKV